MLVTAAVGADVPAELAGARFDVGDGAVTRADEAAGIPLERACESAERLRTVRTDGSSTTSAADLARSLAATPQGHGPVKPVKRRRRPRIDGAQVSGARPDDRDPQKLTTPSAG